MLKTNNPSLDERVNDAYRKLVLILAASNASLDVDGQIDYVDVREATSCAAREAIEALAPLLHAPADIANYVCEEN